MTRPNYYVDFDFGYNELDDVEDELSRYKPQDVTVSLSSDEYGKVIARVYAVHRSSLERVANRFFGEFAKGLTKSFLDENVHRV